MCLSYDYLFHNFKLFIKTFPNERKYKSLYYLIASRRTFHEFPGCRSLVMIRERLCTCHLRDSSSEQSVRILSNVSRTASSSSLCALCTTRQINNVKPFYLHSHLGMTAKVFVLCVTMIATKRLNKFSQNCAQRFLGAKSWSSMLTGKIA